MSEWEAILVDDGATDSTGRICDEYAQKDSRFHVIHTQNQGVSCARNTGMKETQGELLYFMDPDDWIERTMIQELLNKIQNDNVDIVMCDFMREYKYGSSLFKQQPTSLNRDSLLLDLLKSKIWGSCCNKLVSRKCFTKY